MALLFKTGLRLMNDYDAQIKAGVKIPVFDPAKFADLKLDKTSWPALPQQSATQDTQQR